ncbi:unnamed protein product [Calypogeia fissa]
MASEWSSRILIWALAFKCMLMVQLASTQDLGNGFMNFECEMLPVENCAFAVGAGGFRCVLETALQIDGSVTYNCQTLKFQLQFGSDRNSPSLRSPYIETDECVNACGLKRMTVGISTTDDQLSHSGRGGFREKLCSPKCKQSCANIIDHYDTITAVQGEDLNGICEYLSEYLNGEREQHNQLTHTRASPTKVETLRQSTPISNKHKKTELYEQASGPQSGQAVSPNSDQ